MSVIESKAIEESLEEFNDFQFDVDSMVQQAIEILGEQNLKDYCSKVLSKMMSGVLYVTLVIREFTLILQL